MPAGPVGGDGPRVVLLDIEGTTTPVEFVYDALFPFARARVRSFLEAQAADPEVRSVVDALRAEHGVEAGGPEAPPPWRDEPGAAERDSAVAFVHWLMDRDRKSTALKALQGRIWEDGYRTGGLRGQVYADVPVALARWRDQGRRCAIFSSGSVLAQKLLFAHSTAGDLTGWLCAHFDTTTGPKREAESYRRIAAALGEPPGQILFVSDAAAELDAARAAGFRTVLCVRTGAADASTGHPAVTTLDPVLP